MMEHIETAVIDKIRDGLINRYDRDQQIQQMMEEIGAEEGLNEQELAIVYQAYLEVKERMQYTANLVELWNQIEAVQHRMSLLNTYESLEEDLFGDVLDRGPQKQPLGYGASKQQDASYTMEQVELSEVKDDIDTTSNDASRSKTQKKIDKLLKKQMKRIEKEWAKISGRLHSDEESVEDKIARKAAKKEAKLSDKIAKKEAKALHKQDKKEAKYKDKLAKQEAKEAKRLEKLEKKSSKHDSASKKLEKLAKALDKGIKQGKKKKR